MQAEPQVSTKLPKKRRRLPIPERPVPRLLYAFGIAFTLYGSIASLFKTDPELAHNIHSVFQWEHAEQIPIGLKIPQELEVYGRENVILFVINTGMG